MSFCRITGRSRGLPRPNYFPLLPPISPADAKRFCRITGKSYGLPTHHYIPVLLGVHPHDKSKCKITNASGLGPHHYTAGLIVGEKKRHVVLKDYRYVFPILEGEGEQQRALRELLNAKQTPIEEAEKFVYTVVPCKVGSCRQGRRRQGRNAFEGLRYHFAKAETRQKRVSRF